MAIIPVAFRIRNYKSIADSGICSLSGDRITVLAGQNEAGKTSVLQALYQFNGKPGEAPNLEDIVPDHNTGATPYVAIKFSFDLAEIVNYLYGEKLALEKPLLDALSSGSIWIERDLLTGNFELQGEIASAYREVDQIYQDAEAEGVTAEIAIKGIDDNGNDLSSCEKDEFIEALYQLWPIFDYFDSFDDLLPRKVKIDQVAKANTPGTATMVDPVLPSAVQNFLTVSGISLKKVRQLADLSDDEKQLRNYLAEKSSVVTGEFLDYWKQRNVASQTVKLTAEFSQRKDGAYLIFYVNDGRTLQFPGQRSKGFLWFLSFYLSLTASVVPNKKRQPRFILIDEPGSFLHPKAQHDILDVLQRRIVNDNDVVIYSTHSPYLLPSNCLHRVRLVLKEHGSTVIADRLNDERIRQDIRGDALAPIMNAIGIEIGTQTISPDTQNIIIEGITDYYYLNSFAKIVGSDFLSGKSLLVSKGTSNVPYSVSIALACSNKFAVFLDRDSAGDAAAEKLRKEMNINPEAIVQPQSAAGIEDIFSQQDFRNLITYFDSAIKVELTQRPCVTIKKMGIDKVLLSRKFAELVSDGFISNQSLTDKTIEAIHSLFSSLDAALKVDAVFRVR